MPSLFPQPGPQLPAFKTLLVKGNYHPSAPIHISLSYVSRSIESEVVIITPSRQTIAASLQEYNDDWLATNSGLGAITSLSSRVKLFYPPTPAHLCLLLSMLRISIDSDDKSGFWHSKSTLSILPSLVVLHEPSLYFLSGSDLQPNSSHWTISSYMALITHSLSSLTFLSRSSPSESGVAFALFDSQLDQLRLPLSKTPTGHHPFDCDTDQSLARKESVTTFVERYFEWTAVFSQEAQESSDEARTKHKMTLHQIDRYEDGVELSWWEAPVTGDRTVQFLWEA